MKTNGPFFLVLLVLSSCGDSSNDGGTPSSALSLARALEHRAGRGSSKTLPRLKASRMGPDERRVLLFVLPGDASVEVDGRPLYRRNGFVELVGKVGETRKVRVFDGARSTEEKTVAIGEGEATPSLIDLNEAVPAATGPKTKKAKPLVFGDIDE